jgi:heptaprenyl diphosphate synthase
MQRPITLTTTPEDQLIAWLTALAITIHVAEAALPSPFPGMKPGLANIITIAVLVRYGWRSAAWVSMLRVLAGSMLIGTFLSPTFLLSLSGALCSILILKPATLLPGQGFGPVGYSILAALAHMAGQFAVAYYLFIPHEALLHLLPVLLTVSLIFGVISGIITSRLLLACNSAPQHQ